MFGSREVIEADVRLLRQRMILPERQHEALPEQSLTEEIALVIKFGGSFIVTGGKGLKNADNFKLVWELARVLGARLADAVEADGRCDAVSALCDPYPVPVISELIGIEMDRWEDMSRWASSILQSLRIDAGQFVDEIEQGQAELDDFERFPYLWSAGTKTGLANPEIAAGSFCVGQPTTAVDAGLSATGSGRVGLPTQPVLARMATSPFQLTYTAPAICRGRSWRHLASPS